MRNNLTSLGYVLLWPLTVLTGVGWDRYYRYRRENMDDLREFLKDEDTPGK